MKVSRLEKRIVITIMAVASILFFLLIGTRMGIFSKRISDEEWKDLEDYADEVAEMSSYDNNGYHSTKDGLKKDEMTATITISTENVEVTVNKEFSYVEAYYPTYPVVGSVTTAEGERVIGYDYDEVTYVRYQKYPDENIVQDKTDWILLWFGVIWISMVLGVVGVACIYFLLRLIVNQFIKR